MKTWKNPAGYFARLGGRVERAVVGDHVRPAPPRILPSLVAAISPVHDVVAREAGRHEVLRAVLHPLDRLAGRRSSRRSRTRSPGRSAPCCRSRRRCRGDDHRILCSGSPATSAYTRAVRVRRLGRAPERQLAGDRVDVGDRAAGLHRRRVRARVEHVLRRPRRRRRRTRASVSASSPASQSKMWLSVWPSLSSRITGASGSSALRASTTAGSGSYSTSISSSASRAE